MKQLVRTCPGKLNFLLHAIRRNERTPEPGKKWRASRKKCQRHCSGLILVILLPLLTASGFAQTVSLDDYLQRIRKVHPLFAAEPLNEQIQAAERRAVLAGQDWLLRSNPYYGIDEPVSASTFNPEDLTTIGADLKLERALWNHGGRLGVGWEYQHLDQVSPAFDIPGAGMVPTALPKFHQHALTLTYTLPFLQNRGGTLDRLEADLRLEAIKSARLQSQENQEEFLRQSGQSFVDWVQLHVQSGIAARREALAKQQFDSNTSNRVNNAVSRVDLLRSESDWNTGRQGTLLLQSQSNAKRAELAALALWPEMLKQEPGYDLYALPVPTDSSSLDGVRSLRLFDAEMDRLKKQARGLEDQARPKLDLVLGGGLAGGDTTFGDAASLDQPNAQVALSFQYPLGNHGVEAQQEANRLTLKKTALDREKIKLQLTAGLQSLDVQLTELRKVIEVNGKQIEAARKRAREEQRQYELGQSPLTFVLQSRDAEAAAENQRAQNAATYHKLLLERRALLDQILP